MRFWLPLLLASAVTLGTVPSAHADDLADMAQVVQREGSEQAQLERALDELRKAYEAEARRIQTLKAGDTANPLVAATLQTELRNAAAMAEQLTLADARLREARGRFASAREQYRESVAARVEALQFELSRRPDASRAAELDRLVRTLAGLQEPLPEVRPVPIAAILGEDAPTPESLLAAAAELDDYQARLDRQLGEVQSRLNAAERQEHLRARVRDMDAEAAMWDSGWGRRVRARSSGGTTQASASGTGTPTQEDAAVSGTANEAEPERGTDAAPGTSGLPPATDNAGGDFGAADSPTEGVSTPAPATPSLGSAPTGTDRVQVRTPSSGAATSDTSVLTARDGTGTSTGGLSLQQLRERARRIRAELEQVRRARASAIEAARAMQAAERR